MWKVYFITHLKFILKSRFSHVLLNKYISCSTKRGELTWQSLTCHIENVFEHWKAFSLQIEARVNQRKMIQKKNSVLIRKKLGCEITHGCAVKRRQCSATNTAGCERGFSAQNQMKNALRNRLKAERLDVLMTINIEGPPSKDFFFSTALDVRARTNRRISTCTSTSN